VATEIADNSGAAVPGLGAEADAPTSMTSPADAAGQIVDLVAKKMAALVDG
jgi:hypothetical protein